MTSALSSRPVERAEGGARPAPGRPARRRRAVPKGRPAISSMRPARMLTSMPRSRGEPADDRSRSRAGRVKPMRSTAWPPGTGSGRSRRGEIRRQLDGRSRPPRSARVTSVLRPGEDVEDVALLDDAPGLDHRDRGGDLADHRHLVGDEQDGERRARALICASSVEDRARRLRVERGGRLVGEQHLRVGRERPGDADALLLAAGQLGRIAIPLVGEADEIEQRRRPGPRSALRPSPAISSGRATLSNDRARARAG